MSTKKPDIEMATSMTAVACEHGRLHVRLHNAAGDVFACGIIDRASGFKLAEIIVDELGAPTLNCEGVH